MPTRELLQPRRDQYQSYVVRLQRTPEQPSWRITVEAVSTRQQLNFRDVNALAEFFAAQMATGGADQPAPLE